jgi:T-complex protein 1 subunit gamma
VLNETERNLQDAMLVARNVVLEPKLLPGGGATEMTIAAGLARRAKEIGGVEQWPFRAVGLALEIIPRTLAQNCGAEVVRLLTQLRAAKADGTKTTLGVNGETGEVADMTELGVWDPFAVRTQTIKTAVESACLLLRIDDVVAGAKGAKGAGMGESGAAQAAHAAQAAPEE